MSAQPQALPIPLRPVRASRPGSGPLERAHAALQRLVTAAKVRLVPSIADLIFVACVVFSIQYGASMISADGDPARHLVVGEQILSTRTILTHDIFSHTMAGQPFVPYEWLSEVASAASYRVAGLAGPVLLHGAALGLTYAVLYSHVKGRQRSVLLAAAVTLCAVFASTVHWLARPHVFTLLGTATFAAVLDQWYAGRASRRRLWLLPPLMVLWANAHGGFLIGFVLLGIYLAADLVRWIGGPEHVAAAARLRLQTLVPVAGGTLAATLLNPAGPHLLQHVTGYLGKQLLVDRTVEYMSPDFHQPYTRAFLAVLLLSAAALAGSRRRPALHELALFLVFTYFALYSARNIPLFAILIAPVLAAQAAALPRACALRRRVRIGLVQVGAWLKRRDAAYGRMDARTGGHFWPIAALVVLLAVSSSQRDAGQRPLNIDFGPYGQPVAAAAYLRQNPPHGNTFNYMAWGGYLLHEFWPAQRVFIDGQTDFYGESLTREYLQVAELQPGWQEVLDRYRVDWVVYPTESGLVRRLVETPGWSVTYQDTVATVLQRAPSRVGT